jgi:endonuclease/exonuclease/phosphatase (EEP) superfamily protein YafD
MRDLQPGSNPVPAHPGDDEFRLRLRRLARRITGAMILAYLVFLAAVWAGTRLVGERNVTTAFLLYLPPGLWALPAVFLAPLGLWFHRKGFMVMCGFLCLGMWGWAGYRPGLFRGAGISADSPDVLTVMTYNFGQNAGTSFQPFKNATHPDLVVMQEAAGRADGYLRSPGYAEFVHGRSIGEFTLLSRYPVEESSLLSGSEPSRNAPAARFVIDWNGRRISIYAVHLMTPRGVLGSYMRGAFLWGLIGLPGTPWAEKRRHYQSFWDTQFAEVETILSAVKADPNPCVVAGDFNAPSPGRIHSTVTKVLGDAHHAVGRGFGFTVPGTSHNPLSLGGPWMRIDYVFYDRKWEALECVTEKDRASQHRAVMARLRFQP